MSKQDKWLQIRISTDAEHCDYVSDQLQTLGALAVTLQDAADQALFETVPHSEHAWQQTQVVGLFENQTNVAALVERLTTLCGDRANSIESQWLEDEAWERRCLDDFNPMCFGQRLWICPSWSEQTLPNDARIVHLDPGLAFGTGTHPTTRLCLEWLDKQDVAQKTIIDYGCGSGILGIAALKCGALKVIAVDHDEQALIATRSNAQNNKCLEQIFTYLPDEFLPFEADIVLANILAGPLIELAEHLATLCKPAGQLVLSGILAEQGGEIQRAYEPWFSITECQEEQGWLRIVANKRKHGN